MTIEELIIRLSNDPFNPRYNFDVAVEYDRLNQKASAVSFFLRTAEYGKPEDDIIVYSSLLKMAQCFSDQNDRAHTVLNCYFQAVTVMPQRPEACFFISQYYEQKGEWQASYVWAKLGLEFILEKPLPIDVGYPDHWALLFEMAVSGWWLGRQEDTKKLLRQLSMLNLPDNYSDAVRNNMERLGIATI